MSLHHAAQHLASKGRNGDTTLVHMTKGEVAGLQALAKANGTSLTKNPDTGLPEAFGLKSLIPMAAGAALTAMGVPAPVAAGLVGFGTYAQSGSLTQGLMAGMGAYGGAGLTEGVAAAGTQNYAGQVGAESLGTTPEVFATPAGNAEALTTSYPDMSGNITPETSYIDPTKAQTYSTAYSDGLTAAENLPKSELVSRGFSSLGTETGRTAALNSMGGGMGAAKYGLAAAAPAIGEDLFKKPEDYKPPEIKSDADMGQRYQFESGYDNTVPERSGPASYTKISDEEAKKLYGFADGGEVQYPYGESVVRMAAGGSSDSVGYTGNVGDYSAADASAARGGYGLGINYSGYDTPVAPMAGVAALPAARASSVSTPSQGLRYDPMSRSYVGSGTDAPYLGGGQYGKTAAEIAEEEAAASSSSGGGAADLSWSYAAQGGLMDSYAQGGISTLGGYSDGGRLLKGPGDGMSDNIPAQIGAKQPARLADGEFVVPADVVSHLGNGSTDAGAKQLYKMMDKIRTARTGKKAQGKQINPNKFTPA